MIAMAALDVALDLTILCLPISALKGLHMSSRKTLLLMGIFWLGAL